MSRFLPLARRRFTRWLEGAAIGAALVTIPLSIAHERGAGHDPLVQIGDWLVWAVFSVEFLVLLALAPARWPYVRRSWLNVIIVVLTFPLLAPALDILRLARLARLLRLVVVAWWGFRELDSLLGRRGLLHVVAFTGLLIVAGGGIMTLIEPETFHGSFWSGIWWALVTVTTVGYGDFPPVTAGGRLVAGGLMLTGIGLVSTVAASISAHFVGQDKGTELQGVETKLDRLDARLDRLEQTLQALRVPVASPASGSPTSTWPVPAGGRAPEEP